MSCFGDTEIDLSLHVEVIGCPLNPSGLRPDRRGRERFDDREHSFF